MPKTTKKITKKTEEKEKKPASAEVAAYDKSSAGQDGEAKEKIEEEKTSAINVPQDSMVDMADEDISKEIAKTIKESTGKPDRYFEAIFYFRGRPGDSCFFNEKNEMFRQVRGDGQSKRRRKTRAGRSRKAWNSPRVGGF